MPARVAFAFAGATILVDGAHEVVVGAAFGGGA